MASTPRSRLAEACKQVQVARQRLEDEDRINEALAEITSGLDDVIAALEESDTEPDDEDVPSDGGDRIPAPGGLRRI